MMRTELFLKRVASNLPRAWQQELKRLHFGWQITRGRFATDEPEFAMLQDFVRAGDIVLDVGANVGHYTSRLSHLVGATGRVIALEPVFDTFEILAANVARSPFRNVTLLNMAASDCTRFVGMKVPKFGTGLTNFYEAQVVDEEPEFMVMCVALDALLVDTRITFVKIDVEGHELMALRGMRRLLERCRPRIVVEGRAPDVAEFLAPWGYKYEELPQSPNRIFSVVG